MSFYKVMSKPKDNDNVDDNFKEEYKRNCICCKY